MHAFAWSGVQVVTGSCDGFVGAAEAMVASAGAILDVDADVVDGMRQARELIDGPVR
ncbi:MAG: hypothetical protein KF680_09975 [Cryobacterium sp.]|nr:hypothetical protein [Cryobacterium sp.]